MWLNKFRDRQSTIVPKSMTHGCKKNLIIFQALCKRTLNIVEALSEKHADRMRFYLSKADEAGHESDRQRVMMQIVQELCKRPGLNRTGFDMPTIYIPNPNKVINVRELWSIFYDLTKSYKLEQWFSLGDLDRLTGTFPNCSLI